VTYRFLPPRHGSVAKGVDPLGRADRLHLSCGRGVEPTTAGAGGEAVRVLFLAVKDALLRLWAISRTPQGLKVIRYTMVSVISALTSLVILVFLFGVLRLWNEVVCTLIANILAGVPSYILNRRWVWGKGGRSHLWREVLPFWVMSITGIGFALVTSTLAHNFAVSHHLQHLARTVLVVGANIAAFGILWFLKFLILNRLFAEIADAEVGADV
jgi:putative flippase GtrA